MSPRSGVFIRRLPGFGYSHFRIPIFFSPLGREASYFLLIIQSLIKMASSNLPQATSLDDYAVNQTLTLDVQSEYVTDLPSLAP